MNPAERGIGLALRAVRSVSETELLDRLGIRKQTERVLYRATRDGFRAVTTAGRTFSAVTPRKKPARSATARGDLFDLEPTDEQQMLTEAFDGFARDRLRPAAGKADADCAAPPELLTQAEEPGSRRSASPRSWAGCWPSARP